MSNVTIDGSPYIGSVIVASTAAAFSHTLTYTFGGNRLQFVVSKSAGSDTLNAFTVTAGLATTQAVASTTLSVGTAVTALTPVTGSGGTGSLTFAVSPTLPAGLSFNASTGQITGTPTVASTATTYTVTVTDQASQLSTRSFILTVNPAATATTTATTTALTSAANPSLLGQSVVLTASIAPAAATGSVTFSDGGTVLCAAASVIAGVATCTTAFTSAGSHSITATYAPVGAFTASTGALTQAVTDQRAKTIAAIGAFLGSRNDQILSNGPDGQRQIDRLVEAGGGPAGGLGGTGLAAGSATGVPVGGLGVAASRLGDGVDASDMSRLRATGASARPIGDAISANAAGSALGASTNSGGAGFGPCSASVGGPVSGVAALFGHNGAGQGELGVPCTSGFSDGARFGGTMGGMRLNGSLDGAMRLGFATSLRDMTRSAAESDARKLADAGLGLAAGGAGFGRPARPARFDMWVEAKYASFSGNRSATDLNGHIGLVTVGADYVLSPSLLVGVMVQLDSMQQRSDSKATDVRGNGWMAGPYATVRLSQNMFWQVRGAWGQSSNFVSPFQTYVENFESERWLVSSTLAGRWQSGDWSFRPSASISYMEDVSQSYVGTLGIFIPSVKSSLGQAKAGPEIGYRIDLEHTVIEPHAGVQAVYNFSSDTIAAGIGPVGSEATGPAGVRGRVEIGVRALTAGGIGLDMSGSFDGIGAAGSYNVVTGKAIVRVPLN